MNGIYRAAIIGVGRGGEGSAGGHSIGYAHANTYRFHPRTQLVAAADLNRENLGRFADCYGLADEAGYVCHVEMLEATRPDLLSICTYAGTHRAMIEDAVAAGVRGIFCEKPFVLSMDDARAVDHLCRQSGVKLIVNHYRRCLEVFVTAARMVREGAIGRPVLFYAGIEGWDQMEWGSHWLDAFRALAGDPGIKTVSAVVECSGERVGYGHAIEEYSLSCFTFDNGVRAILEGGRKAPGDWALRLTGECGILDIYGNGEIHLRNDQGLEIIRGESTAHMHRGPDQPRDADGKPIMAYLFLMDGLLAWMEGGEEPSTGITNAMACASMYLGAYEAGRRGMTLSYPLGPQPRFPLEK